MNFAARLRELRVRHGISQTDLAKELNLKSSAISKYEKGLTQPPLDTLVHLSKIFSVSIDYLVGSSEVENPYKVALLTPLEANLVGCFRTLSYEDKIRIDERIRAMADEAPIKK